MLEPLCAGKTTLCMAALWALTGSADVRADGKRTPYALYAHTAEPLHALPKPLYAPAPLRQAAWPHALCALAKPLYALADLNLYINLYSAS